MIWIGSLAPFSRWEMIFSERIRKRNEEETKICVSFAKVTETKTKYDSLMELTRLEINRCPEVQEIPALPNLRELSIYSCKKTDSNSRSTKLERAFRPFL